MFDVIGRLRHPYDFSLELWVPRDGLRRNARPPAAAIREARGWLARAEAIMRRTPPPAAEPSIAAQPENPFDLDDEDTDDDEAFDDTDPPRRLQPNVTPQMSA